MASFNIRSPLYISLEILYDCNNYCTGCINELSFSRLRKTDHSKWKLIVDAVANCAAHIRITGGEPTLHPEIEEILSYLEFKNIPFVLFSHGRSINIQKVFPVLKNSTHFWGFLISMHGHTANTHERFTNVRHSFQQMLDGVTAIRNSGLTFFTTTVIRDEIANDVEAIADFALELGAKTINYNRYLGVEDARIQVTSAQLRKAIREVERLRIDKKYPTYIGNCIPQCFEEYEYSEFQITGMTNCTIDPDGNVRAGHFPRVFGNVLYQPIEEIWGSSALADYLNQIPVICKDCVYAYTCPGGSRALANKLGLPQDPLITKPILGPREKKIGLSLANTLCLSKLAKIREEEFGCIIYDLNTMYPLSLPLSYAEELFYCKRPLEEIIKLYGEEILTVIAYLVEAGLVELT